MKTCPWFALMLAAAAGVANGALLGQDADEVSRPVQPARGAVEVQFDSLQNSIQRPPAVSVSDGGAVLLGGQEVFLNIAAHTHANMLGVEVAPVGAPLRAQLGIEGETGVVVTDVTAESPAAQAGLKPHDVILKCGDEPVASPERFHELVGRNQGQKTTFHLIRQGKPVEWTVTLPQVPVYDVADANLSVKPDQHYRIGVTLAAADETLRNQLKLAAGEGLVVTEVLADSPAASAGLRRHDVLTKLDNQRLMSVDKINAQIQEIKDRRVAVVFLRGGEEQSCELAPQLSNQPTANFVIDYDHPVRFWNVSPGYSKLYMAQGFGQQSVQWANPHDLAGSLFVGQPSLQQSNPANAADQIATLKNQLAEMRKTLESLEAALQPAEPQQKGPEQDSPKEE